MIEQRLPSLGDRLNQARVASARQAFAPQQTPAMPQEQPSVLGGGIRAGFNELQALGGSAVAAVGLAQGNQNLEKWGAETASKNFAEAAEFGRPDLETPPWREGGGAVLPWLGYQAAKQIPQVIGGAAVGAATGGLGLGAAVAGRAAMGAAASGAARTTAAGAAAQGVKQLTRAQAKKAASRGAAGGLFATGTTVGAGAMFNEAVERGDPTREDAVRALAMSPIYGAVEAVPQALIGKTVLAGGTGRNIARRVAGGALMGAATEGPTEAVQTAMENTFRPDLSTEEKARRIVDAAATGAAVGGTFGSAGSVRRAKNTETPELLSDPDALAETVDDTITPQPEAGVAAQQAQAAQQARPFAELAPADLTEAVERTVAMAADTQVPPAQQEQARQVLSQLRAEIQTRQDEAPAAELGDQQLAEQAEIAQTAVTQSENPNQITAAQARLAEINEESNRRIEAQEQAQAEAEALPGFEPGTVRDLTPEQKTRAERVRQERREVRLARQAVRSLDESATPSREAERLGLTPYTAREFEQRVDQTREQMRERAAEVEQTRAQKDAIDQDPAATQQERKRAETEVKKAEKNLQDTIKEGRKATEQVRLRERVMQRVAAAQGDINAIQEVPIDEPTVDAPTPRRDNDPLATLINSETPKQRQTRRTNMRDAGITDESTFEVRGQDPDSTPLEISWPEMLDPKVLADRLQGVQPGETIAAARERGASGPAPNRQVARQIANRVSKAARVGKADFNDVARGFNVNFTPAAPRPQPLQTPTIQTRDIPPTPAASTSPRALASQTDTAPGPLFQQVTGTGAPTTPGKAVFNPQPTTEEIEARENPPTFEGTKSTAADTSPYQLMTAEDGAPVRRPRGTQEAQSMVGRVIKSLTDSVSNMFAGDYLEMSPSVRKEALAWLDMQTIQSRFSNAFNESWLKQMRELTNKKKNIIGYFSPLGSNVSTDFTKLKPKTQKQVMDIMELTAYDVSYALPWSEHTHLQGRPDEAFLKGIHEKATRMYRELAQNGGRKVVDDFANLNRTLALENQIRRIHGLLDTDFAIQNRKDFDTVVGRRGYDAMVRKRIRDPKAMVEALRQDRAEVIQIAEGLIQAKNKDAERAGISAAEQNQLLIMSDMLSQTVAAVKDEAQSDGLIPYFHKGRFGDYRVTFDLAPAFDAEGNPIANTEGEQALAEALAAQGITGVGIQENGPTRNVLMKFETESEAHAAFDVAEKLAARGIVDPAKLRVASDEQRALPQSAAHDFKEGLIEKISALTSDDPDTNRTQQLKELRAIVEKYALETSPANSNRRVLAHRRNVHGYSRDMHRSFVHRWQVGIQDAANAITATPRAKVYRGMRDEMVTSGQQGDIKTHTQQDLISEMRNRDQVVDVKPNSATGAIRATNHAWYLGMSPAYMMMTVAHVPIITLPKLGAVFGFNKASSQLLRAAPEAAQVVRVLLKNSLNARNFGESTFTNLSPEILRAEFIKYDEQGRPTQESEAFVEMLLELAETSTMDMGGQMRELGRVAEGRNDSKLDQILRVYGAPGFYSEVYSRLVTGIATYRMHSERGMSGEDLINTTANMVHETMLDYSSGNIGRRTGEKGFAGPITPIVTAFQQYSFQVLGMIYREYHKLYQHNEPNPARRAEARKFLAGHLAAVTVFAGTMGLPFASAASRAVEALSNLLFIDENDEPLDLDTAYRNYLADTFGQDVGEVLSRGLPRAFGMDLSTRLGEQDLLPFSRLLSDRRFLLDSQGTMDAISDAAMRRLGAPVGVPASLAEAVPALMNGDVANASANGAPVAISSLFKAYKMSTDGYTDRNGNPLSITPTSMDILVQAMGISPARKAEESAASNSVRIYNMRTNARKNVIRNQVSAAFRDNDAEAAQEWLAEAQEFDRLNPGTPMLPTLAQTLNARYEKSAIAQITGMPRGADYKNLAIWEMTRFRNSN